MDNLDRSYFLENAEINLPEIPVDGEQNNSRLELNKTNFISDVRRNLSITNTLNSEIYNRLTIDSEGQMYFNNKRISYKSGSSLKLYSIKTLMKSPDTREFLRLIGYKERSTLTPEQTRDLETVSPNQTTAIKSKIDSFKITENWAKEEKEKLVNQLSHTTDQAEIKRINDSIKYFENMETQAKERYNEIVKEYKDKNLIKVTIGSVLTTIGMTITTIILAILPNRNPPINNNNKSSPVRDKISKGLVKLSNFLKELAKKALYSLPSIIGSIVSFILRKGGEILFFLSEHLIILLLSIILILYEVIKKYFQKKKLK